VGYLLGTGQTGQYSAAVLVADTIGLLPVAAGTILFPRLSALSGAADKLRLTVWVSITVGLLTTAGALLTALLAPTIIQVFFGEQFLPAVPAILWLLPGIVPLAINTIYMNYFAADGMPRITIVSPALALVVNVVANLVLIPRLGIVGASVSSSIAYGLMLLCSIVYVVVRRER
jgi:O-antigen/teichoic acid export membrane protein